MTINTDIATIINHHNLIKNAALQYAYVQQALCEELIEEFKKENPEYTEDFNDFFWDIHGGYYVYPRGYGVKPTNMSIYGNILVLECIVGYSGGTRKVEVDIDLLTKVMEHAYDDGNINEIAIRSIISTDIKKKVNAVITQYKEEQIKKMEEQITQSEKEIKAKKNALKKLNKKS